MFDQIFSRTYYDQEKNIRYKICSRHNHILQIIVDDSVTCFCGHKTSSEKEDVEKVIADQVTNKLLNHDEGS